jgi:Flp pilus assembly protein TadD
MSNQKISASTGNNAVPEGWQLVPVEATTEMLGILMGYEYERLGTYDKARAPYRYAALLAAAPIPNKTKDR